MKKWIFSCFLFLCLAVKAQEKTTYQVEGVAFYNVENLFDTENDSLTFDDDRTPTGKDSWTSEKYAEKIDHIAKVLRDIGSEVLKVPPAVIGLSEVENRSVLEDLVKNEYLKEFQYQIVHYDSPDERGIDVALIYRPLAFRLLNSRSHRVLIFESEKANKRDYTRDQLIISGLLNGEELHFLVNHWSSRSGGEAKSNYKRERAALQNKRIVDSIYKVNPEAKIIAMGDFNDNPNNSSFKKILETKAEKQNLIPGDLYNPMEEMAIKGIGSLAYRDAWSLFDQFYLSSPLVSQDYSGYQFYKAGVFIKDYLITQNGQFKGYPYRSYGYSGYEGGYSDHFPIYLYLIRTQKQE